MTCRCKASFKCFYTMSLGCYIGSHAFYVTDVLIRKFISLSLSYWIWFAGPCRLLFRSSFVLLQPFLPSPDSLSGGYMSETEQHYAFFSITKFKFNSLIAGNCLLDKFSFLCAVSSRSTNPLTAIIFDVSHVNQLSLQFWVISSANQTEGSHVKDNYPLLSSLTGGTTTGFESEFQPRWEGYEDF